MKRCIASGLWVENAAAAAAADTEGGEQVYDTADGASVEEVKASVEKDNAKMAERASANSGDSAPNKS